MVAGPTREKEPKAGVSGGWASRRDRGCYAGCSTGSELRELTVSRGEERALVWPRFEHYG